MCCSDEPVGLQRQEVAMVDEKLVQVLAAVPGAKLVLGGYGEVTNDKAALLPESIAHALAKANPTLFRLVVEDAWDIAGEPPLPSADPADAKTEPAPASRRGSSK